MKRACSVLLIVMASLVVTSNLRAQGKFGAGFIFGEPTGISWKYKLNSQNAIDGAIGFSPYDRYRMHVDYLWHSNAFNDRNFSLHYGLGGVMGGHYYVRDRSMGLGFRSVVGINYAIPKSPVEMMIEVAPVLFFAPDGGLGLDAGFGARYFF